MSRPGKYGRQLVLTKDDRFLAINLGYIFRTEHEDGTAGIVAKMNETISNLDFINFALNQPIPDENKRIIRKVQHDILDDTKRFKASMSKLNKNPELRVFTKYLVHPSVEAVRHEIKINNKPIKDRYSKFLTKNGNYSVVVLGRESSRYKEFFKNKKVFDESELLNMVDYQGGFNFGRGNRSSFTPVCGSWSSWEGTVFCLIHRDEETSDIGKQIIEAKNNSRLAIAPSTNGVCKEHGCILIDVVALGKEFNIL